MKRSLTEEECALALSVFGRALDTSRVRILLEKYWFFHPKDTVIAPNGNIYFHPEGKLYRNDFGRARLDMQALFIHEMVHVWQYQTGQAVFWRGIFDRRYQYRLQEDKCFADYGIEQQAEIITDHFLMNSGVPFPHRNDTHLLAKMVPFTVEPLNPTMIG